jgi:hypothetical protein
MSKRFTETEKWKDPWFRRLSPSEKLVFLFLIENCDNAGFYEPDTETMSFHIGLTSAEVEGAYKGLTRVFEAAAGWVWIKNFLKHQKNLPLSETNPAHRQIIRLINEQSTRFADSVEFQTLASPYLGPDKGLRRPTGKGIGIGKGIAKGSVDYTDRDVLIQKRSDRAKSDIEGVKSFCSEVGLPATDGEWFYYKCEGSGWKNNKVQICDWRMTVRAWQKAGIFPSQKNAVPKSKPYLPGASR